MREHVLEIAEKAVKMAEKLGADQAEAYIGQSNSFIIDVENSAIKSAEEQRDAGIGIRTIVDKKIGFAYVTTLNEDDVKEASNKKPLGGNQKKIIEGFNQLRSDRVGGGNPGGTGFPDSGTYWAIEYEKVLEMFAGKSTADRPKKNFDQAISSLEKGGQIVLNGGFLWIPTKAGMMG